MSTSRRNGYSLVELLVTLALVGLLATASLPYVTGGRNAAGLDAGARLLAARLRLARETALADRRTMEVTVDLDAAVVAGPLPHKTAGLPAASRLSAVTARGPVTEGRVVIRFSPDGSSSGGEVIVEAGSQLRHVHVDWLTGAVSISKGAR